MQLGKYENLAVLVRNVGFPLRFQRFYTSAGHWEAAALGAHWRHTYARRLGLVESTHITTATVFRPNGDRFYFNLDNGAWISDPDVTGRLERLTDAKGDPAGWRYINENDVTEDYDTHGRLIMMTNRANHEQTLDYDTWARLNRVSDGFGHHLTFSYDAASRIEAVTASGGDLYRYSYDSADNLAAVTYPDDTPGDDSDNPTRRYLYEDARFPHALTGTLDENGHRSATWAYDAEGRGIASEHAEGTDDVTLTYNTSGTTTAIDALGKQTTFHFQLIHGVYKVIREDRHATDAAPAATRAYTYDANGFLLSRTDWNANLITFVRDGRGLELNRTEAAGTPEERTVTTEWHPRYPLPVKITEPGRITEFTYDTQGRLLSRTERAAP